MGGNVIKRMAVSVSIQQIGVNYYDHPSTSLRITDSELVELLFDFIDVDSLFCFLGDFYCDFIPLLSRRDCRVIHLH